MLKSYEELRKIDITQSCDTRKTKDDNGKPKDVKYLNWAKCVDLLHEHGAEIVYFEPLVNENGSTLFCADVYENEKGQKNRCFEVRVKITIDELVFVQNYPLLNGIYVVREDTINQLRLSNAQARAFVKGVAIRTGLGFSLWIDDENNGDDEPENLYNHSILKVRERVQQLITTKMDGGLTVSDICDKLKIDEDQFNVYLKQYAILDRLEKAIREL